MQYLDDDGDDNNNIIIIVVVVFMVDFRRCLSANNRCRCHRVLVLILNCAGR